MPNRFGVKTGAFAALAMMAFWGSDASGKNITVFDKQSNSSYFHAGVNTGAEDSEIEPASTPGQVWDLEGLFLEGTSLSIVGGYNFSTGYGGYRPGDIFIDVDGDAVWGTPIGDGAKWGTVNNSEFKYDYVIKFSANYLDYTVYAIDDATLLEVKFVENDYSNPWRYSSGGTALDTGTAVFESGLTDAQTGFLGDGELGGASHYKLTVDIGFLGAELTSQTLVHYTFECGNDLIIGQVPDGGLTLLLLGASLIGVALIQRRVGKNAAAK